MWMHCHDGLPGHPHCVGFGQFTQVFCKWISSAVSKGFGGDFKSGSRLIAFVFVSIDPGKDIPDQSRFKSHADDFIKSLEILDAGLKDGIQHFIRRQIVLIGLVGFEFGRWRFFQNALGDDGIFEY